MLFKVSKDESNTAKAIFVFQEEKKILGVAPEGKDGKIRVTCLTSYFARNPGKFCLYQER
jgi:hypothetical protein